MSHLSPDSTVADKTSLAVAFLITLGLAALYFASTGIVAIWPDSLVFADRARHLLGEGRLAQTAASAVSYPPLYSLLMAAAFLVPNFMLSHQILIGLQLVFLCSAFFPIRGLLLTCDGVGKLEASALSIILTLSSTALPYATMLSAEALFIPLFVWFTYFYDKFLSGNKSSSAAWAGVCLGLLLLTKEIGWAAYLAVWINSIVVLVKKQPLKQFFNLQIIPILGFGAWFIYNAMVLGHPLEFPHWELNNGFARFNFFKNGLVYLLYVGMPLAGLALIISTFSKKTTSWDNSYYRFVFFTLLGVLIYTALSNVIVVDHRLDYITNRSIEPFIILPFIAFMRLALQQRKEIIANGMLIFFCLMIIGFPYALKTDFLTGVSYWAQSLNNPNLGIIRNVIYLLLLSVPIIVIWWKPKFFVAAYASIAALINLANIMQDQTVWSINEDGNFKYVNADAFANSADIKDASAIYVENNCNMMQSQDLAYLYRCSDMSKMLYFIPRQTNAITAQDLSGLTLKDNEFVLFASSEHDNAIGKKVAEIGLGTLMRVDAADISALRNTPLVMIKSTEHVGRYINLRLHEKAERVTLLGPDAALLIQSSKQGCVEMHVKLANDADTDNGKEKSVEFILNLKLAKKASFKPVIDGNVPADYVLQLSMAEGDNILSFHYENSDKTVPASLFMFGRPSFQTCKSAR